MKPFLLIAVLALLTVGCKAPPLSNDYRTAGIPLESDMWTSFAGKGPVTLDRETTDYFRLGYSATLGPKVYIVRSDGAYGGTMTCLKNGSDCKASNSHFNSKRRSCAKGTNLSCHVFAIGDKIVWDGDVTFSEKAASAGASIEISADYLTITPRQSILVSSQESKYYGSGPLKLEEGRVNNLLHYLKLSNPGFLIFPENGLKSILIKCPEGSGACAVNNQMLKYIADCKKSGGRCMIFAKGREIVWNGPISFKKDFLVKKKEPAKASPPIRQERPKIPRSSGSASSKTFRHFPIKKMPDNTVCNHALHGGATVDLMWSRKPMYRDLVQEAKDRGFSPEKCFDKIFGG